MRSSTSDRNIKLGARGRIVVAAFALLAAGTTARAADLGVPAPAAPAACNWTSVYVGVNGGYAAGTFNESVSDGSGSGSVNMPGGLIGGQVGLDYQFGSIVIGGEADFDAVFASQAIAVGTASGTEQIPWLGTLRARLGVAFDRFLVYGTAGGAGAEVWSNVNVTGIGSAQTRQTFGTWTAGGGIEYAFTNSLSARVEYLYFGSGGNLTLASVGPPTVNVGGRVQENLVRAGLNLRLPIPH
jgi:outer membrane immunogenic protein